MREVTAEEWVPPPEGRKWIVAALLLVMILASMETTVTSTAMPTIVGALHGLEHYSWVGSIYLLASTITMPLYGRLSDLLGRKRVLMFSIILFAVGSVLASMSQTMWQLIAFRGLQGLGAGGIMPVVLTILGDIFTLKERAAMQAVFSTVWGGAALAGPALGAFLVTTDKLAGHVPAVIVPILGWRSIFWVNLPTGVVAMIVLALKYHEGKHEAQNTKPETKAERRRRVLERLDMPGLILVTVGASGLLAGVSLAAGVSVPWWVPAGSLVIGIAAMIWFVRWERLAKNPIMPAALVMHRSIGPSVAVSGLLGITIFAVDTYVPLYVQGGRGWSAGAAAAAVTPVMLAWSLVALISMPLMLKWGFRALVTIGSVLVLLSLSALVVASVMGAPLWLITVLMFLTGSGISPVSMGTLLAAQDAATAEQRGLVTSSVTFLRNFGGAMGVGMFGALFNFLTAHSLAEIMGKGFSAGDLLDPLKLKGVREAHPDILAHAQSTISWGLYWVFGGMALMAVVMVVMSRMISSHQHHVATREEMLEAAAG